MKKKIKEFFVKVDTTDVNNTSVTITTSDYNEEIMMVVPKIIDLITAEVSKQPEKPKEPELPKEWELEKNKSYCAIATDSSLVGYIPLSNNLNHDYQKNMLPSYESAKNVLALCQLLTMRDRYVGDWKPDWNDSSKESKYCIVCRYCTLSIESWNTKKHTLTFPTYELANTFLNNFKSLIVEAGDLI